MAKRTTKKIGDFSLVEDDHYSKVWKSPSTGFRIMLDKEFQEYTVYGPEDYDGKRGTREGWNDAVALAEKG